MEELIYKINELYNKELQHIQFNPFYNLCPNENNHSNLLCGLLNYNKKELLQSFLSLLNIDYTNVNEVTITSLKDNIDLLIKADSFAVIIENKIYWAKDQQNQIFDYIDKIIHRYKIPENQVFVIYLTADGTKKIKNCNKARLEDLKKQKRFIEKNYKYDLLPWLRLINTNNQYNLNNYIDYFDTFLFNKIENNVFANIYYILKNTDKINKYLYFYDTVCKDSKEILCHNFANWIINTHLYNYIYNFMKSISSEFYYDKDFLRKSGYDLFSVFFKTKWNTEWHIHFEYIFNYKEFTMHLELHLEEGKQNDKRITNSLINAPSLKTLIQKHKPSIFYSKKINVNNDLTFKEESIEEIRNDISLITLVLNSILT